jgi:hypothetical protein
MEELETKLRKCLPEEKLAIVLESLRDETPIAEILR